MERTYGMWRRPVRHSGIVLMMAAGLVLMSWAVLATAAPARRSAPHGDDRAAKRWELAETLGGRGDRAWQAGDARAAVAFYRQSWAIAPGLPPLHADHAPQWVMANQLQRVGNAAGHADHVGQAAALYHLSQVILP